MKFLVAFVLAVACARADVSHVVRDEAAAKILKNDVDVRADGFQYIVETDNGIRSVANGIIKNVNAENPAQEITGEYSYPAPDGATYVVKFVANEFGYQPQGDHLPTPPPVPQAIQQSLDYIQNHPQVEGQAKYSVPVSRPAVSAYNAPPVSVFPSRTANKPSKFGRF